MGRHYPGQNPSWDTHYVRAAPFQEPLRAWREDQQRSMESVAREIDVSESTIRSIEKGRKTYLTLWLADRVATLIGRTDLVQPTERLTAQQFGSENYAKAKSVD